uniref:Keratinocyte associated protein 3 n=1 Tax=Taeniopygia guttata TaxID=59729 RepID=A0A674GR69_TAEGU
MAGGRRGAGALAEPRRLMRSGLGLIVLGHGSLVLGAIVHGSVLRHVAGARRAVTPEYAAANVVSVCSGLLSIAAGIVAILVSHNLSRAVLVSAGLRPSRRWASARPCPAGSRSLGPWPRGLLPPRRWLPVSPVPGSAPPAAPGGWERRARAEALRWAKLQPGRGSRVVSQGGRTRGRVRWAGLGSRGACSPRSPREGASSGAELTGGGRMPKVREPHPRARLNSPGRGKRSCVVREQFCRGTGARPEPFPGLVPVPLVFLPPAALDPAGHLCAELPPVHGVQRGAGAGHRPHGAQPGYAPGPGLQQLRAARRRPCSHCHQRLSLQHHAHLRESAASLHTPTPPITPFLPLLSLSFFSL